MNVLFVGFKYDYGIASRGESLEIKSFYPAIEKNCQKCDAFWLEENGYPANNELLQIEIISYAEKIKPDLIFFILMKDEVKKETIVSLSSKYKTLNWFCDDQWRFDSFTIDIAKLFTYCVTVDKYSIDKYIQIGINPILSQWATFDYEYELSFNSTNYLYEVSFIGAKNITREWIIHELKKRDIHVKCFGSGWNRGKISYSEMKLIFLKSKINLNLSNSIPKDFSFYFFILKKIFSFNSIKYKISLLKQLKSLKKTEQIKARNFEIPGCGGFQLSKFALSLEDYYLNGSEISIYADIDELVLQIKYFLQNNEIREQIRNNGYKMTVEHTYEKRVQKIFKQIN